SRPASGLISTRSPRKLSQKSDARILRRVKGAWWPSRSSKPLSVRQPPDRGRFDSYPLRLTMFDVRSLMFEVRADSTSNPKSNLKLQTSNISRKEVIACRASKFASSRLSHLAPGEHRS